MSQTSRELVQRTLRFEHPARIPRQVWVLPYELARHGPELAELEKRFPTDFTGPAWPFRPASRWCGDPYAVGLHVDDWGCQFTNIQAGVIGEVKTPLVPDLVDWRERVRAPDEVFPLDWAAARDVVNRSCAGTAQFVLVGGAQPWERYQYLRGSENALMDVLTPEEGLCDILRVIHDFYLRYYSFWMRTDIDGISFNDDWGSQRQMLISPEIWRAVFKPLYKDYCDLAHAHGKYAFMHSDGHIAEIYADLVEIGVDAINSQLFCMDMADLARKAKGRITFWGEIDRQHVLPSPDPEDGHRAVREVEKHLYDPAGGIIAQFEFTPGSNPDVAFAIFEEWEAVTARARSRPGS